MSDEYITHNKQINYNLWRSKIVIIETNRLILREYTLDDFDNLYEIVSDPETMRHYPKPFDEERTRG